jgi:phosphoribosylformylglycinamidine cyclo-ligase
MDEALSYKASGVDIDAANRSVEMIKKWVGRTKRPEVIDDIGAFGGMFALSGSYREPVLISGTDGVGTKLLIAQQMGVHDTVGIDLVAMSVNDILVHGAEPLFFLDYIALGQLDPGLVELLVKGVSQGCIQAGCALIGGETAEMPGLYAAGEYDLAGFAVGIAEKSQILDGSAINAGDVVIGIASSGLHSNGFSLARKALLERAGFKLEQTLPELETTLGAALLQPTRIYVPAVLELLKSVPVHGLAHITGGGIPENLARVIPEGLSAYIERSAWEWPAIFRLIAAAGSVEAAEMLRTFNCGIGFIVVAAAADQAAVLTRLSAAGETAAVIGTIRAGSARVVFHD